MDNKYALGGTKVAVEHHEATHKSSLVSRACKFCDSKELVFSPTMHDHKCAKCGEWQQDVEKNYATGRSSEY